MVNESKNMYIPEDTLENHQGTSAWFCILSGKHLVSVHERGGGRWERNDDLEMGRGVWELRGKGMLAPSAFQHMDTCSFPSFTFSNGLTALAAYSLSFTQCVQQLNTSTNWAGRTEACFLFGWVHTCSFDRPVHARAVCLMGKQLSYLANRLLWASSNLSHFSLRTTSGARLPLSNAPQT